MSWRITMRWRGCSSIITNLEQLNRDLESLNYRAGTKSLYVMNAEGEIVASSTWREPINLIGSNYAFRPYFTAAKAGTIYSLDKKRAPGYRPNPLAHTLIRA